MSLMCSCPCHQGDTARAGHSWPNCRCVIRPAHNRWAPNCERFPTKVGPDTQYLIDWHRGETCPVCVIDEERDAVPQEPYVVRLRP